MVWWFLIICETKTQTGFEVYRGGEKRAVAAESVVEVVEEARAEAAREAAATAAVGTQLVGKEAAEVAGDIWQALPRADRGGGDDEELLGDEVRAVGHVVRSEAVRVLAGGSFRTTTRPTLSGRNTNATVGVPAEGTCSYDGLEPGTESARLCERAHSP